MVLFFPDGGYLGWLAGWRLDEKQSGMRARALF